MAAGDSVRRGWQAHRLDQWDEEGRPGLLELQQGNVIVKCVHVIVLVHHDPLDLRYVFGTALCHHADVSTPVTWVRQSAESEVMDQSQFVVQTVSVCVYETLCRLGHV